MCETVKIKKAPRRCVCIGCFTVLLSVGAAAEVVFDGTTGPAGSLSGIMTIPQSQGATVGNNLYHSFSTFNVNTGEGALFTGEHSIQNIISRVTGNSATTIDGFLDHTMPAADFWFINPNGIVFGENASLPTYGAFHASTADYIRSEDGGRFGADIGSPEDSVLTSAHPSAFGFLDANVAPVSINRSYLAVQPGETLSIVGGDVSYTGGTPETLAAITAPSGTVNIASVMSPGEATVGEQGIDIGSFRQGGDISLSENALIGTSDAFLGEPGAGSVYIRGGQFFTDSSGIASIAYDGTSGSIDIELGGDLAMSNGSLIRSTSDFTGLSADISIDIGGDLMLTEGSSISSDKSGSISLAAANFLLSDSDVSVVTYGLEDAGDLTVTVSGLVSIEGDPFSTSLNSYSYAEGEGGDAGNIFVAAQTLAMSGGAIEAATFNSGASGMLQVDAQTIQLDNGARISAATVGSGMAGDIVLNSTGSLHLSGASIVSTDSSFIEAGDAGDISIFAEEVILAGDSTISSSTFDTGNAGTIDIQTNRLKLSSSTVATNTLTFSSGNAGGISIASAESVELVHEPGDELGSTISSGTIGDGDAGTISILTPDLLISDSNVNTSAAFLSGDGGDIVITVDRLEVRDGGYIDSSVGLFGSGEGGNITINASESIAITGHSPYVDPEYPDDFLVSSISSVTQGPGDAGVIEISSPDVSLVEGIILATSSDAGAAGDVHLSGLDSLLISDGASIGVRALDAGAGGNIHISSGSVEIVGTTPKLLDFSTGLFATARLSGQGGSINVYSEKISLSDGAIIELSASGSGNAGSAYIEATDELTLNAGSIDAFSRNSAGGNVTIEAGNLVYLLDSLISAETLGLSPGDNGGNVSIDPTFIVLNNSEIIANANAGNGGNIELVADGLIVDPYSVIDASSATGIDGQVIIETPDRDISGNVVALNAEILDVSQMLRKRCAATSLKDRSSFTAATLAGMSNSPDVYTNGVYEVPGTIEKRAGGGGASIRDVHSAGISVAVAPSQWEENDCYY